MQTSGPEEQKSRMFHHIARVFKTGLLAFSIFEVLSLIAVFFGIFDFQYIRFVVGQFDQGLSSINFANPYIPKCILSVLAATLSFFYLRHFGLTLKKPRFVRTLLQYITTGAFLVGAVKNGIEAYANTNAYFDELGKALLKYEITPENTPLFYTGRRTVGPISGQPLAPVTPAVVNGLRARKKGECAEVKYPQAAEWFAPGTGEPLLWYSVQPNGVHFWPCPKYDPVTGKLANEVTPELSEKWHRSNDPEYLRQMREKKELEARKQIETTRRAEADRKAVAERQKSEDERRKLISAAEDAIAVERALDQIASETDVRYVLFGKPQENGGVYNALAWHWATCTKPEHLDAARAVSYALKALNARSDGLEQRASWIDTYAAALARTGDFDEAARQEAAAIQTLEQSRTTNKRSFDEEYGEKMNAFGGRLTIYREHKPYSDTRPTPRFDERARGTKAKSTDSRDEE